MDRWLPYTFNETNDPFRKQSVSLQIVQITPFGQPIFPDMDMFNERELLDYDTYDDYLDSFIQEDDMFYLRNKDLARRVVALGFRSGFLFD